MALESTWPEESSNFRIWFWSRHSPMARASVRSPARKRFPADDTSIVADRGKGIFVDGSKHKLARVNALLCETNLADIALEKLLAPTHVFAGFVLPVVELISFRI